jgi:predicted transcriptional regulator
MIDQLFGSKTRVKLLQLFYSNPNRPFYVREITRKIDEQINSVRRELSNLLSIGIISSDNQSTSKLYYEVNQSFEYYDPLRQIFGGVKPAKGGNAKATTAKPTNDFKALGNVELVVYTGQFTRDDSSGIDILFVGDINQTQLEKYMEELESKESKELRYVVMSPKEFTYRRQINDRFLTIVLSSKHQVVVDKNDVLSEKKPEPTETEEE